MKACNLLLHHTNGVQGAMAHTNFFQLSWNASSVQWNRATIESALVFTPALRYRVQNHICMTSADCWAS